MAGSVCEKLVLPAVSRQGTTSPARAGERPISAAYFGVAVAKTNVFLSRNVIRQPNDRSRNRRARLSIYSASGVGGEGAAGSLWPPRRKRAISRFPTAGT